MHAVDTNVLVRALTGDDLLQSPAAVAFIDQKGPVWVSHIVLVEALWVLESVYGQGKARLVEVLKRLLDGKDFAMEGPQAVRAALAIYESKSKVDFDDCLILEVARQSGHLPLATFDKALGKIEGATALVV